MLVLLFASMRGLYLQRRYDKWAHAAFIASRAPRSAYLTSWVSILYNTTHKDDKTLEKIVTLTLNTRRKRGITNP